MSDFKCKIRIKKTGEVKEAYAHDNFYGQHNYGYADGEKVYREEEVDFLGACEPEKQTFDDWMEESILKIKEEARQEVIQEIESGKLQFCEGCGKVKGGKFVCGTCEDCI